MGEWGGGRAGVKEERRERREERERETDSG